MTADAPGDDPSLMRTSDHARLVLRRAQLALAALAVPVALAVGTITADPVGLPAAPATVQAGHDLVAGSEPAARPGSVVALARAEEVAARMTEGPVDRRTRGVLAGLATLAICWSLLFTAGAIWRRTLAARDLREWAAGWRRVEPRWSNRRV